MAVFLKVWHQMNHSESLLKCGLLVVSVDKYIITSKRKTQESAI